MVKMVIVKAVFMLSELMTDPRLLCDVKLVPRANYVGILSTGVRFECVLVIMRVCALLV
jgi:hypothetical protein